MIFMYLVRFYQFGNSHTEVVTYNTETGELIGEQGKIARQLGLIASNYLTQKFACDILEVLEVA